MQALTRGRLLSAAAAGTLLAAAFAFQQREPPPPEPADAAIPVPCTAGSLPGGAPSAPRAAVARHDAGQRQLAPQAPGLALQEVGREGPGRPDVALIRVNGGPARAYAVGDAVDVGVRLKAIRADGVELERGGVSTRLALAPAGAPRQLQPVAALRHGAAAEPAVPAPQPAPVMAPAQQAARSSTAVERAIARQLPP